IEPRLRRVTWHVRQRKSRGQKEWLVLGHRLELLNRPAGDDVVALVLVAVWKRAPVHERIISHRRRRNQFRRRPGSHRTRWTPHVEFLGSRLRPAGAAVINFARREGLV